MFVMASLLSGLSYILSVTKQVLLCNAVVMALRGSSVMALSTMLSLFSLLLSFNAQTNRAMAALDDSLVLCMCSSSSTLEGLVNIK